MIEKITTAIMLSTKLVNDICELVLPIVVVVTCSNINRYLREKK